MDLMCAALGCALTFPGHPVLGCVGFGDVASGAGAPYFRADTSTLGVSGRAHASNTGTYNPDYGKVIVDVSHRKITVEWALLLMTWPDYPHV